MLLDPMGNAPSEVTDPRRVKVRCAICNASKTQVVRGRSEKGVAICRRHGW